MNKKCNTCGNKNFTAKKVQYIYKHNSDFLIVNDVPCIECDYCGEQYFEGKVLEKIEELFFDLHENRRKVKTKIEVPVENFLEVNL